MANVTIRPVLPSDRAWVRRLLVEHWGATQIVSRGHVYQADGLPAFAAAIEDRPVGLAIYRISGDECEIVTLNSMILGAGRPLVDAVRQAALGAGCGRVWLITTNDNLGALRFYQKIGFVLVAVHANALEVSRRLKPSIPLIGIGGIPLRDEIELEMRL